MRPFKQDFILNLFKLIFSPLLIILSFIYGAITEIRNFLYQIKFLSSRRLPGKVISVGNIQVGGTGKTPVVMEIATQILAQEKTCAILTRGYKSGLKDQESIVLLNGKITHKSFSEDKNIFADEAILQSHKLKTVPVLVGANRYIGAQEYLKSHESPDYWILDDGFQHRKIARDLDILLLDAKEPFSNGWLLPFGRLRELRKNIKRADMILWTRCDQQYPTQQNRKMVQSVCSTQAYEVSFETRYPRPINSNFPSLDAKTDRVLLVCGIAGPADFVRQVQEFGIAISQSLIFKDHQAIKTKDIVSNIGNCTALVTTEKDYYRDPKLFRDLSIPVYVCPLELKNIPVFFYEYKRE